MTTLLWANLDLGDTTAWHLVPLVVVVSLVYAATRHEEWGLILHRAARWAFYVLAFMVITTAVLWAFN